MRSVLWLHSELLHVLFNVLGTPDDNHIQVSFVWQQQQQQQLERGYKYVLENLI